MYIGEKIHYLKRTELTQDTYPNTDFDISGIKALGSTTIDCVG
jgi:hypothetical protein